MIEILILSIRLLFVITFHFIALINVSMQKVSLKESVVTIMLIEIANTILYIMFGNEIIINIITATISVLFLCYKNRTFLLSIFFAVIATIVSLTINNGVTATFYYAFQISIEAMRKSELVYWAIASISAMMLVLISRILGNFFKKFLFLFSKKIKIKFVVYILIFLLISLFIFYLNVLYVKEDANNSFLFLLNAVLLTIDFTFIVFIFYAYFRAIGQSIEITHKEELLQNLNEYIKSIENMNENIRSFRHDVKNVLSSLYCYIEDKDLPGLEAYFKSNIAPISDRIFEHSTVMDQLKNVTPNELKGTLAIKFINAIEHGVTVHIEVQNKVEIASVNIIDLIKIVGILLDNAIEECQKSEGLKLQFALFKKRETVIMLVINQIANQPPEIPRLYEDGYSTKGIGRGLGLNNLQKIIDSYDQVMIHTRIEADEFVQEITIT